MSWQEELRKLDERLAAGQISADEYRVSRDQLLSIAASPAQQQDPSAAKTQFVQPVSPAGPPPGGEHDDSADKTQIVPGQSQGPGERTQAISQHGPGQQTQAMGGSWQAARPEVGDSERTQIVQGLPLQQPHPPQQAGYQQQYQQHPAPWNQQPQHQQQDDAPPWAGSEFPPLASQGNPDWIKQGPEVFEPTGGGKGKVALIVLIAVLVLGGLGAGGYFLFGKDSGQQEQAKDPGTSSSTQPPTTTKRPKDDLEIAPMAGDGGEDAKVATFEDVRMTELLTDEEKNAYLAGNAGKARMNANTLPADIKALVLTVQVDSPDNAVKARDQLVALQRQYTMKPYPGATPAGVTVLQFEKSETLPAVVRGHYTHKGTVVRVQVAGNDLAQVSKAFDEIITAQLEALPADA